MIIIKPKVNFIPLSVAVLAFYCLFTFPELVAEGAKGGVKLCLEALIPSLFPFMVLGTFIINTGAFSPFCKLFSGITEKIFLLPEAAGQIILMSLVGGYPVGAKLTNDAYKNGLITEDEAKRLCIFCLNSGPAFTVSTLGIGIYGNEKIGVTIYASLCISSLILGFLTRFLREEKHISHSNIGEHQFSSEDISLSVWISFESVLKICAWVILFASITNVFKIKFGADNAIAALLEVTGGALTVSKKYPIPVVAAICGFGGLCVHCQVLKNISECSLEYRLFFVGRVLNAALASAICYLILHCFPQALCVSYTFSSAKEQALSVSLPTVITFIFMCISMIFNIDRRKKIC